MPPRRDGLFWRHAAGVATMLAACGVLIALGPHSALADQPAAAAQRTSRATGPTDPRLESFDRMVEAFRRKHDVPGIAVAVTDGGRLVLARGYGVADRQTGRPVKPTSLFRIASLSKPITAVAVVRLCEEGKLSLDQPVLPLLDLDAAVEAAGNSFDPRWNKVTVRQLLMHRGGWDRDASFDPMFQSRRWAKQLDVDTPPDAEQIIRAMLSQPLDYDPGTRFAYSNFGYALLGRVVEAVSGCDYEQYVQRRMLAPLGIDRMRIGATRQGERADGEVCYYHRGKSSSVFREDLGEKVPAPYGGWCLEAMDAHGGWIGSAVDLAKFAVSLDEPAGCPVLAQESIRILHARPRAPVSKEPAPEEPAPEEPAPEEPAPEESGAESENASPDSYYYSLGWSNRVVGPGKINHWHTGSLPGTAAILIRRHDGRNFVALMNTRQSPHTEHLIGKLDALLHRTADAVTEWPGCDHFGEI